MVYKILDIGLQSPETTSQNFQLPYIFCKVDLYIVVPVYNGDLAISQGWPHRFVLYLFPIDTFVN